MDSITQEYKTFYDATADTNAALVAAVAGRKIVLDMLIISTADAEEIMITDGDGGADLFGTIYAGADSPVQFSDIGLRTGTVGNALSCTWASSGAGFIYGVYHLESGHANPETST